MMFWNRKQPPAGVISAFDDAAKAFEIYALFIPITRERNVWIDPFYLGVAYGVVIYHFSVRRPACSDWERDTLLSALLVPVVNLDNELLFPRLHTHLAEPKTSRFYHGLRNACLLEEMRLRDTGSWGSSDAFRETEIEFRQSGRHRPTRPEIEQALFAKYLEMPRYAMKHDRSVQAQGWRIERDGRVKLGSASAACSRAW